MHNLNDNKGETYFLVFLNVKSSRQIFCKNISWTQNEKLQITLELQCAIILFLYLYIKIF